TSSSGSMPSSKANPSSWPGSKGERSRSRSPSLPRGTRSAPGPERDWTVLAFTSMEEVEADEGEANPGGGRRTPRTSASRRERDGGPTEGRNHEHEASSSGGSLGTSSPDPGGAPHHRFRPAEASMSEWDGLLSTLRYDRQPRNIESCANRATDRWRLPRACPIGPGRGRRRTGRVGHQHSRLDRKRRRLPLGPDRG